MGWPRGAVSYMLGAVLGPDKAKRYVSPKTCTGGWFEVMSHSFQHALPLLQAPGCLWDADLSMMPRSGHF